MFLVKQCMMGDNFNLSRKNKDMLKFNQFGKTLVEFCRINNVHIFNGRLHNDSEGNFTCVANSGASTVDYAVGSSELFTNCTDFDIEERIESDHFPIYCQFIFKTANVNINSKAHYCNSEKIGEYIKFRWSENKANDFL